MADENESRSKQLNNRVKKTLDEYSKAIGEAIKPDDAAGKFLCRCAVRNMSVQKVKRMWALKPEIREKLEEIYCISIHEGAEMVEEDQISAVIVSEWFDAALAMAEMYPDYMGTPLVLKIMLDVAGRQPYSDYEDYFDGMRETDELDAEQLLCMRNMRRMSKEEETGDMRKRLDAINRKLEELAGCLPEGFILSDMEEKKDSLGRELKAMQERKSSLEDEMEGLEQLVRQKSDELEKRKREEKEAEESRRFETLKQENERLKQLNASLRQKLAEEGPAEGRAKPKKAKRFAFTKKAKKEKLIGLMLSKGCGPEYIRLVSEAVEKKAPLKDLIKLVMQDIDADSMREVLGMLKE